MDLTTLERPGATKAAVPPGRGLGGSPPGGAAAGVGELPPLGNTGAVPTEGWCVDYLETTFKDLEKEGVLALFTPKGGDLADWTALPCGRNGYRQGAVRGELRCYWDGAENMGVHVVASGSGCRQLEAEGIVGDWEGREGYAARLLAKGAQVSRIDIAVDDRIGHLDPVTIDAAVREGRCVSRFRQADPRGKVNLETGKTGGWSCYFGAASSRVRARFYDKQAEQIERGCADPGHWMRVELQARDERGDWVLRALAGEGREAIVGLLFNYVDFKEAADGDTNRSRWRTARWWSDFLGAVEKRRCTVAQVFRTVEQAAGWFMRQVAPTFALLRFARGYGDDWLDHAFAQGAERLKEWQLSALAVGVT